MMIETLGNLGIWPIIVFDGQDEDEETVPA